MFKVKRDFFYALLIYITSVAQMPQVMFYFVIMLIGIYHFFNDSRKFTLDKPGVILIIFIVGSVVSFLLGKVFYGASFMFKDYERSTDLFPFTILLLGTIFFSKHMSFDTMRYLLYFILFEAIIAVIEYLIGIQYLIYPGDLGGETKFGETDLLYYNRVFGLSPNVSVLGLKLVVGIVFSMFLFEMNKISKAHTYLFILIILIASILSFQRTAILTVSVFFCFYFLPWLFEIKFKYKVFLIFIFVLFVLLVVSNSNEILFQFTRGNPTDFKDIRAIVFGVYIEFISNNLIWGNYSEKIYMSFAGHSYHAHNSYLQFIATVGMPLFFVWILFFTNLIKGSNFVFILPFLFYSLAQYGIFWGCSLFDISMYSLIFLSKKESANASNDSRKLTVVA
ncbi:hypothetical protein SAMN05192553_103722 [Cyclobacterium xiamenense]|uniref:O-antigen ligase-related domain-containing protein n=1 Tax=Cyclobacterium xiamenense TaxID=1297121 RepID=A0A1H6YL87_9BACT|nr:O-antigen ligase family protein [Cyclobacterium xiamenense]SEJ40594.1 hypothetical protein SAMN05192553_103722 [Cyclobacterium xiamenense]